MEFLLDPDGKCTCCAQPALNEHIIKCCSCSKDFHAICHGAGDRNTAICNKTFLNLFTTSSTKTNFKWFCDTCLTYFETNKATTVDDRFSVIARQISDMTKQFKEVKDLVCMNNHKRCQNSVHSNVTEGGPWADDTRVSKMKSSLVVTHKDNGVSGTTVDLNVIKKIAVENSIPVSNIGISKKGNAFVHCPSVDDRDRLEPLIKANLQDKDVVSIKDKSPHISIVDIINTGTEELTKEDILSQICSQNHQITELINSGSEFNILFVKRDSRTDKYTAVVRVSCNIRDFIKSNRNRIYIGINSCRVFDRFYVKRCNKCQQFGHFKDKCPNHAKCAFCSETHESHTCSLKVETDVSKFRCVNCKNDSLPDAGHSTFWTKCPSYVRAQNRLRSTIPYYDNSPSGRNLNY